MRTLVIDMSDFGGEASEGDKVRLYAPRVRGSAHDSARIITPADRTVTLDDGRAEVASVEPGPLAVQLKPKGGLRAGTSFETAVPEGDGPVTLRSCLESNFQYEPPIVSAVQQAAQDVSEWHDRTVEAADRVGSAEQVGVWAESASSSATAAGESAGAAADSASAADGSAQAAAQSATSAATSEGDAETWAQVSEDAATVSVTAAASLEQFMPSLALTRDDTVGTRIFAGDVMIFGDTGWRDITADIEPGKITIEPGGYLRVRRTERHTWYAFYGLTVVANGLLFSTPSGFRLSRAQATNAFDGDGWIYASRFWLAIGGYLEGQNMASDREFQVLFEADPQWPSTLPGTPY